MQPSDDAVLDFILELLIEAVGEALFELVAYGLTAALGRLVNGQARAFVTRSAQFAGGVVAGLLSLFVFTTRLTPRGPLPGLSLLLAPLATGTVMHGLGEFWQDRRQRPALFTFTAAATFAFGMALVRLIYFTRPWFS